MYPGCHGLLVSPCLVRALSGCHAPACQPVLMKTPFGRRVATHAAYFVFALAVEQPVAPGFPLMLSSDKQLIHQTLQKLPFLVGVVVLIITNLLKPLTT